MEIIIALLIPLVFIIGEFLGIALLAAPGALIRRLFFGQKNRLRNFTKSE
jgi:hypothetical protein